MPGYSGVLMRCMQFGLSRLYTNPKRERGESRGRSPRSRFGLVWPVCRPRVNRCSIIASAILVSATHG